MANDAYAKRIAEIGLALKEDEHPDIKTKDIRFLLDCLRMATEGVGSGQARLIARLNERAKREE